MPVAAVSQPIQQRTRFRSSRARRVAGAAEQAKRRKWRRRRDKADEGWGELQLQLCPRNSGWAGHCGDEDYSLAVLGPLDRLEAASLSAGSAPCMDPPACVQFGTPTGGRRWVGVGGCESFGGWMHRSFHTSLPSTRGSGMAGASSFGLGWSLGPATYGLGKVGRGRRRSPTGAHRDAKWPGGHARTLARSVLLVPCLVVRGTGRSAGAPAPGGGGSI